jgi:hypothetical protein
MDILDDKKRMLDALEKSLGVVTTACQMARVGRSTHYDWMSKDAEYAAAVRSLNDVAVDFGESALFEQIKAGNPASTIFFLKTRGKHRGYVERMETEAVNEQPKRLVVVLEDDSQRDEHED